MEQYYFLFGLAFAYLIFAVVQDLKTREIANWLNFSLIAFALAYRAFYSSYIGDWMFFAYGVIGVLLFVVLGYAFYYSGVFAGGDAKLLFGLGAILPYEAFSDYIFNGLGFVFLIFICGIIYTLIYSLFLIRKNFSNFRKEFWTLLRKTRVWTFVAVVLAVALTFALYNAGYGLVSYYFLIFAFIPALYAYSKAIENSCMIKLTLPGKLTEGDWLVKDVRVGGKWVRKTTRGLNSDEIALLKKAGKKVLIKDGVPFTPAFLIAFLIFVWRMIF